MLRVDWWCQKAQQRGAERLIQNCSVQVALTVPKSEAGTPKAQLETGCPALPPAISGVISRERLLWFVACRGNSLVHRAGCPFTLPCSLKVLCWQNIFPFCGFTHLHVGRSHLSRRPTSWEPVFCFECSPSDIC